MIAGNCQLLEKMVVSQVVLKDKSRFWQGKALNCGTRDFKYLQWSDPDQIQIVCYLAPPLLALGVGLILTPLYSVELVNSLDEVCTEKGFTIRISIHLLFQLCLQGLCSLCVQHGRYQSCFQWPLCSQRECGSSVGTIWRSHPISQTWYSKCLLNYVLLFLLKRNHTSHPSPDW